MNKTPKKSGFTMIEFVVVTAIIAIISVILSAIMSNGSKSFRAGTKRVDYNESAIKAERDFERYSRGATQIIDASQNEFTFLAYFRADTRPAPTKVGYYLQNNCLNRFLIYPVAQGDIYIYPDENKITTRVVENVVSTDPIFGFYDDSNTKLAFPATISRIKMASFSIMIDSDPASPPGGSLQTTNIQFRNLKTNL